MEKSTIKAEPRVKAGTGASRALRVAGRLPAIIYGHGETPEPISMDQHDVEVALAHGARTLDVEVGSKSTQYLIKEVQYDHYDNRPIHLDLARVNLDERVKVRVGIELRGTAKGAAEGGMLEQVMADLEVECVVTQIPETLRPVVTELALGDSLSVKDLELPAGVVALADPNDVVATVRLAAAFVDEEESGDDGEQKEAQPEVIGRVRKDEDEPAS